MIDIITTIFVYYLMGCLIGVIESWNKKVMFYIWLIGIIYILFCIFIIQKGDVSWGEPWYYVLWELPLAILGIMSGRKIYKIIFGGKK